MGRIELAKRFYSLPRITAEDREELFKMFHKDLHYVGVGKDDIVGRDVLEDLYKKYHDKIGERGVQSMSHEIKHIAENKEDNCVLVDLVNHFVIGDRKYSAVFSIVLEFNENDEITFWQEHYDLAAFYAMFEGADLAAHEAAA